MLLKPFHFRLSHRKTSCCYGEGGSQGTLRVAADGKKDLRATLAARFLRWVAEIEEVGESREVKEVIFAWPKVRRWKFTIYKCVFFKPRMVFAVFFFSRMSNVNIMKQHATVPKNCWEGFGSDSCLIFGLDRACDGST